MAQGHETGHACAEVREEFSALLDDELSAAQRAEVESHLAGCSDCLRALDAMKKVSDLYAALPRVAAPADFELRLQRAIRPKRMQFTRRTALLGLAAAAGFVLMVAPYVLLRATDHAGVMQVASQPEMRSRAQQAAPGAADGAIREQLDSLGYLRDAQGKAEAASAPVEETASPQMNAAPALPEPPVAEDRKSEEAPQATARSVRRGKRASANASAKARRETGAQAGTCRRGG